ncbi:MAG: hypothetical protein IT374_22345 [Polyangiaceae bacterium]|nr:hypothetical protein [Polyangiaceae bacterium]
MIPDTLPTAPAGFSWRARYAIRARERRAFHTVLDADKLVDPSRASHVSVGRDADGLFVQLRHPVLGGEIAEDMRFDEADGRLLTRAVLREVRDSTGGLARREEVLQFHHATLGLPTSAYPEVALPFVLAFCQHDGKRRSLFAWINDRFVARVYVDTIGRATLDLPIGRRDAIEAVMYPDLNDWVSLGAVITRLARPLLPKYRMWFDAEPPHGVLRFEGPYGPPGAPEIVLSLSELG